MTVTFDREDARRSALVLRDERLQLTPAVPKGRGWAPSHLEVADLCGRDCADIGTVLEHLTAAQRIFDELPPAADNRVAAFNSLYFTITDRVAQALRGPQVRDKDFLELLDVEFAKRYFSALRLWGDDDAATPDAWEVLFRRAQDHGVSKLAAAMLGVNAHINHDLALALVSTWEQLGPPDTDETHPDYRMINQIFFDELPELRRRYSTPLHLRIDSLLGTLDDWSQRVLVAATRARAWDQAQRLWALRDDPDDLDRALLVMDRSSAYVGELLLLGDDLVNRGGTLLRGVRDKLRGTAGEPAPRGAGTSRR